MGTTTGQHLDLRTLDRFRDKLQLDWADIAATLSVDQSTVYRWRNGEALPRPMALSRLAQLDELMQLMQRLFAGPDLAREWLKQARPEALGGRETPLEIMRGGRIDKVLMVLHFLARGA
jgi:predicted DNA-binding transcriptional regulator AlpA